MSSAIRRPGRLHKIIHCFIAVAYLAMYLSYCIKMGTPLKNGENYLFFPKGNYAGGKVVGTTTATVSVVCTKRYIFIAPKMVTTTNMITARVRKYSFGDGVSMEAGLQSMLDDPQMTVETLEEELKEFLGTASQENVIEVAKLDHFKIHMLWILSQARFSMPGGSLNVLSFGKPSNMKLMQAFYFPT